ncbi:MAG: metallopeptidase family protein [Dehalococcoidales bacterium]|nr:metallopeptidase family protein [Dehalococcoidales bacterium]
MDREKFEQLVALTIQALPDEFTHRLENIVVVVEDWPSTEQLHRLGFRHSQSLLGLYEGVPLTKRSSHYGLVTPDKITIFQKPIERKCGQDDTGVADEIARVVKHEIAHHFGISDARLKKLDM